MAFPVNETDQNGVPTARIRTQGFIRPTTWLDAADVDRELYGTRFGYLCGESKIRNSADITQLRPYANPTGFWNIPAYGMMFTVPQALPGSENIRTNGSGATINTRGGLTCRAYAEACVVEFGARQVSLDGLGGFAAVGAYQTVQLDFTGAGFGAGTPGWLTDTLLLPPDTTGASFVGPGDLIQLYVAYKSNDGINPSFLSIWDLFEPALINANP